MRKSIVLGSIAALGLTGQALAQDGFSYNYLEGNYVTSDGNADVLGFDNDADGFNVRGSVAFTPMFHGYADFTRLNIDVSNLDVTTWEVGVGLNHSLNSNVDFVTRAGYLKVDPQGPGDTDGFSLQTGLRTRPMDRVEFDGMAHYIHLPNFDSTSLVATARYNFTNMFAGDVGVEFGDHTSTWNLGLRYTFK